MKAIKPHAHCLQYLRITINLMRIRSAPQLFCWCHRFTDSLIEPPSRLPRPWLICCWMVGTLYIQYYTVFKKMHIYIYMYTYICIYVLIHSIRDNMCLYIGTFQSKMDQKETYLGKHWPSEEKDIITAIHCALVLPAKGPRFPNPDWEQQGRLVPLYIYDLAIPPS